MDRDRWLKERGRIPGVGASQSSALFNLHPYESAFSLFESLVNPRTLTEEEEEGMRDEQEFGLAIEVPLANWYARKTGRPVQEPEAPGVYRLADRPYVFCSPDRFIPPSGVLQLKSGMNFNPNMPLPDSWAIQEQHECLVTGAEFASFAIWGTFRKRYYINDVPANPAFQAILVETIDRFMAMVQTGVFDRKKWEVDGASATREALVRLYGAKSAGTEVLLDQDDAVKAAEWQEVKQAIAELQMREKALNNQLRAAVGPHAAGRLPDGSRLKRIDVKGSRYEVIKEPTYHLKLEKPLVKGIRPYEY